MYTITGMVSCEAGLVESQPWASKVCRAAMNKCFYLLWTDLDWCKMIDHEQKTVVLRLCINNSILFEGFNFRVSHWKWSRIISWWKDTKTPDSTKIIIVIQRKNVSASWTCTFHKWSSTDPSTELYKVCYHFSVLENIDCESWIPSGKETLILWLLSTKRSWLQ